LLYQGVLAMILRKLPIEHLLCLTDEISDV
jgi:hypothetical protein